MPDITMCASESCPMRERCYRATAEPNNWQSWSNFTPADGEACQYFWPDDDNREKDYAAIWRDEGFQQWRKNRG